MHDVIDALVHKDDIISRFEGTQLTPQDAVTLVEAFKLFVRQVVALRLTSEQVRKRRQEVD